MTNKNDGIYGMLPREKMDPQARAMRDYYAIIPDQPLIQKEFGYYCKEEWIEQGLDPEADFEKEFGYNISNSVGFQGAGWVDAEFSPAFEEKIIEDRGEHEVVQDKAGRLVLCFKNRRNGFMPEYLDSPVKDHKTWEEKCKWRLDPNTPARYEKLEEIGILNQEAARKGYMITQRIAGGIMYLRSLMGPEGWLYMLYDDPELVHDCMKTWFKLADAVITNHQKYTTIDELFIAEDGCYKSGSLISREIMKEFLFPYYQQLITNLKSRQLDSTRHLYIQIDTDGFCVPVIDWYHEEIGMDAMSPFEVASGCDVVKIGQQYPWLIISGGIDKRVLAQGKDAIDKMVDYIMPAMKKRGGYLPTCDHGVPAEVSLENYRYYRKRALEFA